MGEPGAIGHRAGEPGAIGLRVRLRSRPRCKPPAGLLWVPSPPFRRQRTSAADDLGEFFFVLVAFLAGEAALLLLPPALGPAPAGPRPAPPAPAGARIGRRDLMPVRFSLPRSTSIVRPGGVTSCCGYERAVSCCSVVLNAKHMSVIPARRRRRRYTRARTHANLRDLANTWACTRVARLPPPLACPLPLGSCWDRGVRHAQGACRERAIVGRQQEGTARPTGDGI